MAKNYCSRDLAIKFDKAGLKPNACSEADGADYPRILYTEAEDWLDKTYGIVVAVEPYITVEGFFYLYKVFEKASRRHMVRKLKERTGFDTICEAREAGMSFALDCILGEADEDFANRP